MWLLLTAELLGNLEAGSFLLLRKPLEGDEAAEIVHISLRQAGEALEVPLLRGDALMCEDAFDLLSEDLEASDVLLQVLDSGASEELEELPIPGSWIELDERTLLNLDNSTVLSVAEDEGHYAVVFGAAYGSLQLFLGGEDEADGYLNAIATVVGASEALTEAASDISLGGHSLGALLGRVKKGEA